MNDLRNNGFNAASLVTTNTGCRTCGLAGWDNSLRKN
jgi:hypothetical protein